MVCEANLADYVEESINRIKFHGLDLDLANLTVQQPSIKVLKVEVSHGMRVARSSNEPVADMKKISHGKSLYGFNVTRYSGEHTMSDMFGFFDRDYAPYLVAVTALIESPMKLYV